MNKLPRYFPPGYFNRWFWLMFAINTVALGGNLWLAFDNTFKANDLALFINCASVALTFAFCWIPFVRRIWKDTQRWQKGGREKAEAQIAELALAIRAMHEEVAPIIQKHMEQIERDHHR